MFLLPIRFFVVAITALVPWGISAGTLDDAPFRVVVPGPEWKIDDSTAQPAGKDVFLVATISKTNTILKSVIIKAALKKISKSSLDELCSGIRESFANPAVKKVSEADTTFLGYTAKRFIYQIKGEQTTHNEAIVFVAGDRGWTVACVGSAEQKDEIRQVFDFFQKKAR